MDRNDLVEILAGRTSLDEASYSSGGAANVGQPALWTGRQERLAQNWRDVLVKLEALFLDVLDADENVYGECIPILKDVRTAEGESCWECLPRFRTLHDILTRQQGSHWARFAVHMQELVTDMEWMCDQLAPKDDLVPEKPPKEKDDWQADQDADLAGLPKPSKSFKPANESTTGRPALPPFCPSLVMASLGRAADLTEASSKVTDFRSAGDAIRLAVETYTDASDVEVHVEGDRFTVICEWNGTTYQADLGPSILIECLTDYDVSQIVLNELSESTDARENWNAATVVPTLYSMIDRHHAGDLVPRFKFDEAVAALTSRVGLHEAVRLTEGELNVQFTESVETLYGYFWDWEQRYGKPFPGKDSEGSLDEEVVVEQWESGHLLVNLEAKTVSIVGMDGDEKVLDRTTTDEDATARLLSISTQRESYSINPAPWADNFRDSLVEGEGLNEAFLTVAELKQIAKDNPIIDMTQPGAKARMGDRVWCGPEKQLGRVTDTDSNVLICTDHLGNEYQYEDGVAEDRGPIAPPSYQGESEPIMEPGFVKGPEDEKKWDKAKKAASKQDADEPYALANHIFHKMKGESWEKKLAEDLSTDDNFSDTFTGHVVASDKLTERGTNWFGKERCRNCGQPTPKNDMRGENCRKCDNEINKPDSVQKKDWHKQGGVWESQFREALVDVEEATQISFNPAKHPRGPDGRFIKGKHASRSEKGAATQAGKKRAAERGHQPMTSKELDTAVAAKKDAAAGIKSTTEVPSSEKVKKPRQKKQRGGPKPFDVVQGGGDAAGLESRLDAKVGEKFKAADGQDYELVGRSKSKAKPFQVKRLADGKLRTVSASTLGDYLNAKTPEQGPTDPDAQGVETDQKIPDRDEKAPELTPEPENIPSGNAPATPPEEVPQADTKPDTSGAPPAATPEPVAPSGEQEPATEQPVPGETPPTEAPPPAAAPQGPDQGEQAPAAGPDQSFEPKTKADAPKIKPKPSTSDVSAYEPDVDQEFGQKETEPTPPKRPEVPDAPGAPVDITGTPPEQEAGDETPQASFVSPDAAPYGDKSIQQAQPPKGFEDIIEPVTPNFVQKYRRPPEDIANTSDEDFVQIRDYIYNQAAQALQGDEADPAVQNVLKQSQRDVEDLLNAMREEAAAGGEEFAGLTDEDYEGAVRGKMRDRLEAEVDRMMQEKSDQPAADEETKQKRADMWEKILGHVGSFAGFTWDLLKDIYSKYIGGAGY